MNPASKMAAISPRDQLVAVMVGDDENVTLLDRNGRSIGSISICEYMARYPDTFFVEIKKHQDALEILSERSEMSSCLDMFLLLFDKTIGAQTKSKLAEELDLLVTKKQNSDYILDIILSKPLPKETDIEGSKIASEGFPKTFQLLEEIISGQKNVQLVFKTWRSLCDSGALQEIGEQKVLGLLSNYGVIRQIVLGVTDQKSLELLKQNLIFENYDFNKQLGALGPKIINQFFSTLQKEFPKSSRKKLAEYQVDYEPAPKYESPKISVHTTSKESAIKQVIMIAELFANKNDEKAKRVLNELISQNLANENHGENLAVKSLCNVATQLRHRGRPEISLYCLSRASMYKKGIDAALYCQMGEEYKHANDFDAALKCFEAAERISNESVDERIINAKINIQVSKGLYSQALNEYQKIPNWEINPFFLIHVGDLYRKMGVLEKARETYKACLKIEENSHRALTGLANVWRQKGKLHRAIPIYTSIIQKDKSDEIVEEDKLDFGSRKIYQLALSRLLRMTNQFSKAESFLLEIEKLAPYDWSVNFQLARLYYAWDKDKKSSFYFDKSRELSNSSSSVDELRQAIFCQLFENEKPELISTDSFPLPKEIMPEDSGLANCYKAFNEISSNNFDYANHILTKTNPVDQLLSDFSNVLQFHIQKVDKNREDYKYSQRLCKIAKKGTGCDSDLYKAIHQINEKDFDGAFESEFKFIRRVA